MKSFGWLILSVATLLPAVLTPSCKSRIVASKMRGLNDPESFSAQRYNDPAERAKTPVLIYYLNHSHYSFISPNNGPPTQRENFSYLLQTLKSCQSTSMNASDAQLVQDFTERLLNDEKDFERSGYSEYGTIRSLMSKNQHLKHFIFRNALAAPQGVKQFEYGGAMAYWVDFPAVTSGAPEVYQFQPLMRPEVFESALRQVMRLAPPDKHRYILIAKSHGNDAMAMTAFLARDVRSLSPKQICDAMLAHQKSIETKGSNSGSGGMGKDDDSPMGKDDDSPMGKDDDSPMGKDDDSPMGKDDDSPLGAPSALDYLGQLAMGKQGLDAPASQTPLPGITKQQFADTLVKTFSNMYFPIVVMESCRSGFSFSDHFKRMPNLDRAANISYIYTSDKGGLDYRNFNYNDVFVRTNHGEDLQDVIKSVVEAKLKK